MKNLIYLILGVVSIFSIQACRDRKAKNYNQQTSVDQFGLSFIKNALEGGLTEIKASGLVITKSNNQRIIAFAKMMINEHTRAVNELKKIENDEFVIQDDTISVEHQKMIGNLADMSGPAFDKSYMQVMVDDHEKAISIFSDATQNDDAEIQSFAKKTLPTIQMHLDSAKAIFASLK